MKPLIVTIAILLLTISIVGQAVAQPLPPRDLRGKFENNIVFLKWGPPFSPSPPSFYKVYRADDHQMPIMLGTTHDTTYNDSTVALNKWYFYAVTAVYHDTVQSLPTRPIAIFTGSGTHDSSCVKLWFTSRPKQFTLINEKYEYTPTVMTMPAGVQVCFNLEEAPEGMTIDNSTGLIQWTPTNPGIYNIEIKARPCDGRWGHAEQKYNLFVFTAMPGSIEGIVKNVNGYGLRGVLIKLFDVSRGDFVMKTMTDDAGRYRFPYVNPTTYYVRAKPLNEIYAPQWYDGASSIEDATPVVVTENDTAIINFTLLRNDTLDHHYFISGRVMDSTINPIAGARVQLYRIGHDRFSDNRFDDDFVDCDPVQRTLTDANGNYHFYVHRGIYIIAASAEGYRFQFWDHKSTPLEADRLRLTQDTSGIDFNLIKKLKRTGAITGVIYNAKDSSGLRSHVIGFMKESTNHFTGFITVTHTDSSGRYTLDHLPNGKFIVLAHPGDDFIPTFYNTSGGTPYLDQATPVEITGTTVSGIDIYVRPDTVNGLNVLSGRIDEHQFGEGLSVGSIPVVGAIVSVTNNANEVVRSAISENNGTYNITGIAPGKYNVVFQKPGYMTTSMSTTISYINDKPASVTLNSQMINENGPDQYEILNVRPEWNLLSVPRFAQDFRKDILFPTASSSAFSYKEFYIANDVLTIGAGYWLRFNDSQMLVLPGAPIDRDTVDVMQGWNLVGSISQPILASSITSIPGGLVTSQFFKYTGSYQRSDTISPGYGYWVNVRSSGKLILSSSNLLSKSERINIIASSELPPPLPDNDGLSNDGLMPGSYELYQNWPNPFNPTTRIIFDLPEAATVTLKVYNLLGQNVATLIDHEMLAAGQKSIKFDASPLGSGIYLYQIQTEKYTSTKKMVLIK